MSNSEIRKSQSSDGGSIQPSDWRSILAQPKPGQEREKRITGLDVVFIIDTTGSMYQYLEKVRQELAHLANKVYKCAPDVQIGVIAYGDYCDANSTYVTKTLGLTGDFLKVEKFVNHVERTGGGDAPEAVEEALYEANRLRWRAGSQRVIILVGDAPPHGLIDAAPMRDYKEETYALGKKRVKIYTAQCGGDKAAEKAFRWMASNTGGIYLLLENIGDIVDLLIGVCMKEVGMLEGYSNQLEAGKRLSASKERLFKQLKGS